jgi:hypothetical protein
MTSNKKTWDRITEMLANLLFMMCSTSRNHSFEYVELCIELNRANKKSVYGGSGAIAPSEFVSALTKLQDIDCLVWRDNDHIEVDFNRLKCVVQTLGHITSCPQAPEFVD